MRRKGLHVLSFNRYDAVALAPFGKAVPILSQHLISDGIHCNSVIAAELIYRVVNGQFLIVAERPAHICTECLFEPSCQMSGHGLLAIFPKVIPEECVDFHHSAGIYIVALGAP